jgi:hypothetical protein
LTVVVSTKGVDPKVGLAKTSGLSIQRSQVYGERFNSPSTSSSQKFIAKKLNDALLACSDVREYYSTVTNWDLSNGLPPAF